MPASDDLKRCTKCQEEKPREEFRRDRSRKDGRYPQCKACERLWRQEHADYMADYHRRWQQANVERKRETDRRYRIRKREDPEYRERRRARDRFYRARKRARLLRCASRGKRRLSPRRPGGVRGTGPKSGPKDLDPPSVFDRWCGVAGQGAPRPSESVGAPPGDVATRAIEPDAPTRRPPRRRVGVLPAPQDTPLLRGDLRGTATR
jgi:hypothetical protein